MKKLPLRHLSVRVPWHDRSWDGRICEDPLGNASCMYLPRIQSKDVAFEEAHKTSFMHEIGSSELPPCVSEKVTFMSPHDVIRKAKHPYAGFQEKYEHFEETDQKYPAHSFSVVPFRWMLKDKKTKQNAVASVYQLDYDSELEPDLGFDDTWVQHHQNQKVLLDAFSSAIEPEKSLVFVYAKNIPLVDTTDRILIGVGRISKVESIAEYKYKNNDPSWRGYLWERQIFHTIRQDNEDGFLLPYGEVIEKLGANQDLDPEEYIARASNFEEFSYGAEHVSHDAAINALISLRRALINCGRLIERSYEQQLKWINDQISEIWNMRGAFPGLGAVLSAMKVPEGNLIAWEIEKHIRAKDGDELKTNPWDLVEDIFQGKAEWLDPALRKNVGRMLKGAWEKMPAGKKDYLKLLSRIAIDNEQAEVFYGKDEYGDYVKNPYLLFEESLLGANPISFNALDKAVIPVEKVQAVFPLGDPSLVQEPVDPRRAGHVDRDEVDGLLWDPMPGGSGLIDQICERFEEIVAVAREVVEDCPAACETSCIDCLQTFRNGYYHKHLNRHVALERLNAWGPRLEKSHDIPAMQPAQAPAEGSHPVNEAERKLRHLLLAAGFEEGIRGEQIRLDRAIGSTTPDVIYRAGHHGKDEGICIYLDGLSGHIHGNPERAEQDQRIRSWLRNNCYEVIEIAVSDLDDEGAMSRHFRKLAGYLGANELRDSLRADTSWFSRAKEAAKSAVRFKLRVVQPREKERYISCVPLIPLKAAAGAFSDPQNVQDSDWDWVEIDTMRKLRKGMFVAQVVGKSMEPAIPDGSHCLFAAPVTGTRQGKTVLVQLRDPVDFEGGERYTVKRYESKKVAAVDGTWRHLRITLKPHNPDFKPIELTCEAEGEVQVIAELVEVLG